MLKGVLAGLGAGALWGLVFVAPRMVAMGEGGFSSVDLAASRYVVYGLLAGVLMFFGLRTRKLPTAAQCWAALYLSLLGNTFYYLLVVLAVRDAGSAVPTLIIGTIPIWVMLLGKPGHLSWAALLPGLLLTALGLALMMGAEHGVGHASNGAYFWRGVLLAACALLSWTAYAVWNAHWLKKHPEVSATDWANWLGVATGLGALLLWLVAGTPIDSMPKGPLAGEKYAWLAIISIAMGIGASWLAAVWWNMASQTLSPSLCGQLIVSETVFGLLYSFAWDASWPSGMQWAACVCFVAGILFSIRAHR
jgi:drug/metabolite transporter (DMT)-like permease